MISYSSSRPIDIFEDATVQSIESEWIPVIQGDIGTINCIVFRFGSLIG
jgi:hypothetical protein